MAYNKAELLALPPQERIELADELLHSAIVDNFVAEQEWKKKMINERLKYHDENQSNGIDWEELKKQYGR